MIKLLTKIPGNIHVACSGGVDSMAALDFLQRRHSVTVAFFDHGTVTSCAAGQFLSQYCHARGISMVRGSISETKLHRVSLEEHWRNERYKWLESLGQPVITAHHLDDAVETWVWSSMHGHSRLPHVQRGSVMRPFLGTAKRELISWCQRHAVPWIEDQSNLDTRFTRNYIRHQMMPHVLKVNPGIQKMVKKRLLAAAKQV
jgi:tRNA(Ile)-lysidine synthase